MTTPESAHARDDAQLRHLIADQMRAIGAKDLDRLMIIVGGFVLLGLSVLAGRWVGSTGTRSMEGVSKMLIPC